MDNYSNLGKDVNESLVVPQIEGMPSDELKDYYREADEWQAEWDTAASEDSTKPVEGGVPESGGWQSPIKPFEETLWGKMAAKRPEQADFYRRLYDEGPLKDREDPIQNLIVSATAASNMGVGILSGIWDSGTEEWSSKLREGLERGFGEFMRTWDEDYNPDDSTAMRIVRNRLVPDEEGQEGLRFSQRAAAIGLELASDIIFTGGANAMQGLAKGISRGLYNVGKTILLLRASGGKIGRAAGKLVDESAEKIHTVLKMAERGDQQAIDAVTELATHPDGLKALGRVQIDNTAAAYRKLGEMNSEVLKGEEKAVYHFIKKLRKEGDYELLERELDGYHADNPHDLARDIWDINSAEDARKYVLKRAEQLKEFAYKSIRQVVSEDELREGVVRNPPKEYQKIDMLLKTQKTRLKFNVADNVVLPVDDITAYAYNQILSEINQVQRRMMNFEKDLKFSSAKIDMVRDQKLWAFRQALVSDLTGKPSPTSRLFRLLDTSTIRGSTGIRMAKLEMARKRMERIAPSVYEKIEASSGKPLRSSSGITAEQFGALVDLLPKLENVKGGGKMLAEMSESEANALLKEAREVVSSMDVTAKVAKENVRALYRYVHKVQNERQLNNLLNGMYSETGWQKLHGYFVNSLLSDTLSDVANATSNATKALLYPLSDTAAGLTHMWTNPERAAVNFGTAAARMVGLGEASMDMLRIISAYGIKKLPRTIAERESVKNFTKTKYIDNLSVFGVHSDVLGTVSSFSKEGLRHAPENVRRAYYVSQVISLPTKALTAGDQVFKALAYRSDLRARNWVTAWQMARDPVKARLLYNKLTAEPMEAMKRGAFKETFRATYQEDLTKNLDLFSRLASNAFFKWFTPFVKIGINLARHSANLHPVTNLVPVILDKIDKPWLFSNSVYVRDNAIVRALAEGGARAEAAKGLLALTNGMFLGLLMLPTEGYITGSGGLPMPNAKRTPYEKFAMKTPWGGTYYYGRNPVLRVIIGVPITMKEIWHQIDWGAQEPLEDAQALWAGMLSLYSTVLLDETFLRTASRISDGLIQLMNQGSMKFFWDEIIRNVWSMAPGGGAAKTARRVLDPVSRDADTIFETFMNKYGFGPLMDNPESIDLFGNRRYDGFDGGSHSINISGLDPLSRELRRLRPNIPDVPEKDITIGLTEEAAKFTLQERKWMRRYIAEGRGMGNVPFKNAVIQTIASPDYRMSNDEYRRKLIVHTAKKYIDNAVAALRIKRQTGLVL